VDKGSLLSTKLDVNLSKANFKHNSDTKLRVLNPVANRELILHRIWPQRAAAIRFSARLLPGRLARRRPGRSRFGRRRFGAGRFGSFLTKDVIALAGSTLDTLDIAARAESGDDVLSGVLALATVRFNISTKLRFDVDSELVAIHSTYFRGIVVWSI
jgi:hypothetical protein